MPHYTDKKPQGKRLRGVKLLSFIYWIENDLVLLVIVCTLGAKSKSQHIKGTPVENLSTILTALTDEKVIAYPTEGVFGVGCDPDSSEAVKNLLAVKERAVEKGLILIAASYEQLIPYIDESQLSEEQIANVKSTWPGPVTWIMPAGEKATPWVTGQFDSIAVRVSDHPLVQMLCQAFGKPITSTSANLSGLPPCMTAQEVEDQLGDRLGAIVYGETGGRDKPTEIRDARTLAVIREG